MKVAAYQAPLLASGCMDSVDLIRLRVEWCESERVEILCCPEAVLGGLADYSDCPERIAIRVTNGDLNKMLSPIASETVTTIVGFTELADDGELFNAAAVYYRGTVLGVYRKLHPAIRNSVYKAGDQYPIFQVSNLKFGIVICWDSSFPEPARVMADAGATALFVPTNNALPKQRQCDDMPMIARTSDVARALENSMYVIRAEVAGANDMLVSYGCSEIVDPSGNVLQSVSKFGVDLIVANISTNLQQNESRDAD